MIHEDALEGLGPQCTQSSIVATDINDLIVSVLSPDNQEAASDIEAQLSLLVPPDTIFDEASQSVIRGGQREVPNYYSGPPQLSGGKPIRVRPPRHHL